MINCFNTFDPLQEMILGDVDHAVIEYCDPSQQDRLKHIFDKTKHELDVIQDMFKKAGVRVHRPTPLPNKKVITPYWTSRGIKIPLTPRDTILTLGQTVIETASWQKERFFETYYYRNAFAETDRWISMPLPRHDYKEIQTDIVPNQDPILDAPAILKYGKDLFVSAGGSHNDKGIKWLRSCFPEYRIHQLTDPFMGHLDSHITILRPGLLMTHHDKLLLPNFFSDWEVIQVNPQHDRNMSDKQTLVDAKVQDDDFANTVLAVNTFSIDRNTVVMYDHYKTNSYLIKQLESKKIDIQFVKFTYSHFFNQGVTCITNDLARNTEGLQDYT
jgi:N-dimethylarginine dimethylaminohydrolase